MCPMSSRDMNQRFIQSPLPGRSHISLEEHITKDQLKMKLEMVESHGELFLVNSKTAPDPYMYSSDPLTEKLR